VTLSEPQAALARRRVADAGLDGRVEIQVRDYRELAGEHFDAVASVGMVEHVGESRIDEYARTVAGLLAPRGRFLNHGITRIPAEEHPLSDFSERYVFPDGEILRPSRMLQAFEEAGFQTLHAEELREDYAETLRHWARRFDENLDEAVRLGGEERARVWRLYLRAARNGFEVGHNSIHQLLCERLPVADPGAEAPALPHARPWVRRKEPRTPERVPAGAR
jgi:cyclopropane-fatty-acyl-phospholipid synthase